MLAAEIKHLRVVAEDLAAKAEAAAQAAQLAAASAAVEMAGWGGFVLPRMELSGFKGHPVVEWTAGAAERLADGPGPMLERQILSLWELWPQGTSSTPPPTPLKILGLVLTTPFRRALGAARELRGWGSTMILCDRRPTKMQLCEADVSGAHVAVIQPDGECDLLVKGRIGPTAKAGRTIASRYWEERLFDQIVTRRLLEPSQ